MHRAPKHRRHGAGSALPFVVACAFAMLLVQTGCKSAKYAQRQREQERLAAGDTTRLPEEDTSQSQISRSIDSMAGVVGDFFSSLLPKREDTTKEIVMTPPRFPDRYGVYPPSRVEPEGFLNSPIRQEITFDTSGNAIVANKFIGGTVNQEARLPLEDYILERQRMEIDRAFRRSVGQVNDTSQVGSAGGGGDGWFSDYNNITIPIPPSIVPGIFGKQSVNLRVAGDVALHLAYRDNQFLATSGALFSGSETGLDFRQEINMSINGSIGDKLKIGADWGSERSFQFENLLKLGYKGYPHEILQSLEAGNVNLVTPSQYIGTQQALFGLKAIARFGPAYFTALAAQKKGDRQTKTFGGGGANSATSTEFVIKPSQYRRNAFFLDHRFIPNFEKYYSEVVPNPNSVPVSNTLTDAKDVEVWVSTVETAPNRREGIAWLNLPERPPGGYDPLYRSPTAGSADTLANAFFTRLDTSRYSINRFTGVVTLSQEVNDQQVVAVSFKMTSPQRQFGDPSSEPNKLVLKLVKPIGGYQKQDAPAWTLMLKNQYYVGGAGFDEKNFAARVIYTQPTGEQIEVVRSANGILKVVSMMGLDRANNSNPGDVTPDGLVDVGEQFRPSAILDRRSGVLMFPYLEPFGKRVEDYYRQQQQRNSKIRFDSTFYFPQVYRQQPTIVQQNPKNNQITINVKFAGGVSGTLNLNAFNIVEGSVRVTIGGRQLQEGVDYRVDNNSGTVTLLKPDLITTGGISVDYETHDIFTNATKSVLGFRAELPVLDKGLFGISLMNYAMRLPSLKTRQGEEPLSNWILGWDASYRVDAPVITDMLNAIPIFNLKEKSDINFKTDMALSLPNPNTRESPIPADNGLSIAYLDDYESGKNQFLLWSTYGRWVHASQPVDSAFEALYPNILLRDSIVNSLKSRTYWFEKEPKDVPIKVIKPNRSTQRPGEVAQVLDVIYEPGVPGPYNHHPSTNPEPRDRWGGLMQYSPGLNVPATNTDAIEFWMKVEQDGGDNANGLIRFDLGRISEDIIPDKLLQKEDRNGNARYDPGEDVGLDGLTDDEERARWPDAENRDDPDRDNYVYETRSSDYTRLNGTEGNQNDRSAGLKPDTEDLDGNGSLDADNSYYEYEIPIRRDNNRYIVGQGTEGWYQYRIPLSDFRRIIGTQDSSFTFINTFRFWFKDLPNTLHIRLHEIALVGSQWTRVRQDVDLNDPLADEKFKLSYVNIEENSGQPTNYTSPPGAERDRLAGSTSFVLGNEQSLELSVKDLGDSLEREALRVFQSPHDIFNYRGMAIFVHGGDDRPETILDSNRQAWVHIRFGTNDFNYYEYRRPLARGWQNIHIDFQKLTALKGAKLLPTDVISVPAEDGVPGSTLSVVGSPTLTNAPIFKVGVRNQTGLPLTTNVWYDELRLLDANDRADIAMNGSTQIKLAEFGRITASIVNERPDFHRVDERFNPTRVLNFNWNVTGEFAMQKTFPAWLEKQSVFPLTVSHTETILRPKYLPNTDVEIQGALDKIAARQASGEITQAQAQTLSADLRQTTETVAIKNSIAATGVKLIWPGSFFMLPGFLNRLTYGFGYGEEFSRSPQYEYNRQWSWTGTLAYDLPQLPKLSLSPWTWWGANTFFIGRYADWKINFLPQNVSLAASATRGRTHTLNRITTLQYPPFSNEEDSLEVRRSRVPFINRVFTATRGMQIRQWKLTEGGLISPSFDYSLDVTSNLVPLETRNTFDREGLGGSGQFADSLYKFQRPLSEIIDDIFMKDGALVRPGRDFTAQQRITMNTSPRMPWFFGLEKLIRPVFSYRVDYRWQDAQTDLQNGKIGAWNNTITTGLELNVRDLGVMIFGKPVADEQPNAGGRGADRVRRGDVGVQPEELRDPGLELRDRPIPSPRREPRDQVQRGESFRPQSRGNPLDRGPQLLDTLNRGAASNFDEDTTGRVHIPGVGTAGIRDREFVSDTVLTPIAPAQPEPEYVEEEPPITIQEILQAVVQKPLFDWNGTRFNFVQTNTSQNGALMGNGSGITNFLARGIFAPEDDNLGPSRAYQLGLITDPHGRLLIGFKPEFPFVKFGVRHGDRSPSITGLGTDITDVFTQQNNFELSTSRPLWEGATISLNWKLQFSYDQRNTLRLNAAGVDSLIYFAKSGDVSRTFLSIPQVPFLSFLQSGIEKVGAKYRQKASELGANTEDERRNNLDIEVRNRIQEEAFMEGFETLPFFSGFLREYLPRLNYTFNWSGLEKFPLFSFADKASFRHGYNGNYKRGFRSNSDDNLELTTLQTILYGFRPLIGLDMSWEKFYDGRLTTNANYDTQTEWGADYSSARINKRLSTTIGITAQYNRQGLSLPFIGLNLKNEFGASFTFSKTISNDSYFDIERIQEQPEGIGNGGITKTTIEPRVSYNISQQLSIEGFYRYERTIPAASGQLSPPTRLIMAGVDVRLKIQ